MSKIEQILEKVANYYFYKRTPPKNIEALDVRQTSLALKDLIMKAVPEEKDADIIIEKSSIPIFNKEYMELCKEVNGYNLCRSELLARIEILFGNEGIS